MVVGQKQKSAIENGLDRVKRGSNTTPDRPKADPPDPPAPSFSFSRDKLWIKESVAVERAMAYKEHTTSLSTSTKFWFVSRTWLKNNQLTWGWKWIIPTKICQCIGSLQTHNGRHRLIRGWNWIITKQNIRKVCSNYYKPNDFTSSIISILTKLLRPRAVSSANRCIKSYVLYCKAIVVLCAVVQ